MTTEVTHLLVRIRRRVELSSEHRTEHGLFFAERADSGDKVLAAHI